jgi:hypothetical protein
MGAASIPDSASADRAATSVRVPRGRNELGRHHHRRREGLVEQHERRIGGERATIATASPSGTSSEK